MTPKDIKADRQSNRLFILWPDETQHEYSFRALRIACRCAHCVDEHTGERILDPATVSAEIQIESMALVGNYAIRIKWSDGHDTGIYTWEHLGKLGETIS